MGENYRTCGNLAATRNRVWEMGPTETWEKGLPSTVPAISHGRSHREGSNKYVKGVEDVKRIAAASRCVGSKIAM
jgi:hypothetical protein